jgi:hypothetical protein
MECQAALNRMLRDKPYLQTATNQQKSGRAAPCPLFQLLNFLPAEVM